MAIKRSSKVDSTYSASSMTDLIFLLLVFFVLATTLINPNNAVKMTLPSSSSSMGDPSAVSISVLQGPAGYNYIFNGKTSNPYMDAAELALELNAYYETNLADSGKPLVVSVHCQRDETTVDALLKIIDMINEQNQAAGDITPGVQRYKMVLATDKK